MSETETVSLDLLDRATVRKRARGVGIAALLVGAALGGIFGLFAGPTGFVITMAIVALPLLLLAWSESRKTIWLRGDEVCARAFGTRRVVLGTADRMDVLITDARGVRTVSLLVGGRSKAISVALAMYAGTGGQELGIYPMRRLADALASTGDAHALVLSELVVAQLRAEARGDSAADRPLYQLASLAPQGRLAQKIRSADVAKFVAALG